MRFRCKPALLSGVICLSLLYACVYDDMKDCPQGINVRFYSKIACSLDTVYPEQVQDLILCVFDNNGRLVSCQQDNSVEMQAEYIQTIKAENGLFTVVAWAGLKAGPYDIRLPEEKITTKADLLFRLQRAAQQAVSIEGKRVYYGESPTVFLPDPEEAGSVFENTAINLQEITNRVTISVEGLPNTEEYAVVIESANGSMNIDGSIAQDDIIRYASQPVVKEGIVEADFTLLKLETGHHNTLIIQDKKNDRELFRGDLLGTLLLRNPGVNLACDHDFMIRFTMKDQCKCGDYMIMEIWVNNWLVHSYETDL